MDSERIYRLSIPGIIFILTLLFFHYFFGGDLQKISQDVTNEKVYGLIGVFLATPVLGLIISTIGLSFIFLAYGYRIYITKHPSQNFANKILEDRNDSLKDVLVQGKAKNEQLKEFYWEYQTLARKYLEEEALKFLARRWTFFFIHFNNITAIFISLIVSFSLKKNYTLKIEFLTVLIWIIIIAYCFAGAYLAKIVRKDAMKIEEKSIMQIEKMAKV